MAPSSAAHLLDWSPAKVRELFDAYDAVLFDCDGVLWNDAVAVEGAPETVNRLKALGKRVYFVTNNSLQTRREIWQRAQRLGFAVDESEIVAPTYSICEYLKRCQFRKKVYYIGYPSIGRELDGFGIAHMSNTIDIIGDKVTAYIEREVKPLPTDDVGAVIIGFDEYFTYAKMLKASHYLGKAEDCLFIATNIDAVHRYPEYHIPGTGAILKSVETCVGRQPMLFGKPDPRICAHLVAAGLITPQRTLMVGDCCKIDMPFGKNCGFSTMLVSTGMTRYDTLQQMLQNPADHPNNIPDFYLPALGDLLPFL